MNNETQSSRYGLRTKVASVFLSAALLATTFTGLGGALTSSTEVNAANDYGLADHVYDGVIVHAWNWSFTEIKNHMKDFADAGYTSVQTSPVQRPKDYSNTKTTQWDWWKVYQPTTLSFSPDGHPWFGTKDEFKAMCDEADKYGIKIIVDVVSNHLANDTGGKGNTRADISSQNDPTYRDDDSCWHLNGSTGIDYGSPKRDGSTTSLTWGFGGWPDLNTGSKKVQNGVIDLLKECIDLGADGFRFDAAKHIEVPTDPGGASDFWPTVINGANDYAKAKGVEIYCYGEILDDAATDIKNYTQYIGVTDNRAGNNIRYGIRNGNIGAAASSSLYYNGVSYDKIVLWAESHDTYANDDYTGDSTRDNQDQVNRTWAIVAARQYPALYYIRPTNPKTQLMGEASTNTSYKNTEVAEVNKFHNYFTGQSEYMSSSGNNVLVERGTSGVVITNIYGNAENISAKVNKMADGTYKDQVSGNTFTVSGGTISGQLGSKGIAVVYNAEPIVKGSVSATPATDTSFDDTLTVTLKASDVTNAKYTTSEGASGTYTDGQTITVGASTAVGGSVTVTLSGTKSDGTAATATYTYNKKDPDAKVVVYFDNSSYNWSSVYAYVYDESSGTARELAAWPGTKMPVGSSGFYELEIPDAYTANGQVIFAESSSSSNRYPADQLPGLKIGGSSKKFSSGNTWENYTPVVKKLSVSLSTSVSSVTVGTPITLTATAANTSGTVNYTFTQGSTTIQASSTKSTASWTPSAAGTYTITVTAKDSSGTATASKTVTVVPPELVNNSTISATSITLGQTLTLKGAASGGTSPYKYAVYYKQTSQTAWTAVQSTYASTITKTVTPKAATTYTVRVKVKDSNGTITNKDFKVTVKKAALVNSSTISATSITLGNSLTLKGAASGGTGGYTYAVFYKKTSSDTWTTVQGTYASTITKTVTPKASTTYTVRVKVKDSAGTIVNKDFKVTVKYAALVNNSTISATSINLGTSLTLKGAATGGSGSYTYAVYYKQTAQTNWTAVQSYASTISKKVTPLAATTYTVRVKVKDSAGTIANKDFTVKVTKAPLVNTSTISATTLDLGKSLTLKGSATGGTAKYTYAVYYKKTSDTAWTKVQDYASTITKTVTPKAATTYTVRVKAKDSKGTIANKDFKVTVKVPLTNNSTLSATSIALGNTVTVKASATGGSGYYNYAVFYKKASSSSWTTVQSYKAENTIAIKLQTVTTYDVCVKVKDSNNVEAKKYFTVQVTPAPLTNTSTISSTSIVLGDTLTLKGAATGGTSSYTYGVYYKQTSQTSWTAVQSTYASTITKTVTPKAATTYTVRVKVKDAKGTIANKDFTVKVGKALSVTATASSTSVSSGSSVTVTGVGSGGTGGYTYEISYLKFGTTSWTTAKAYNATASKAIKFTTAGQYSVKVNVKDSSGKVATAYVAVEVS